MSDIATLSKPIVLKSNAESNRYYTMVTRLSLLEEGTRVLSNVFPPDESRFEAELLLAWVLDVERVHLHSFPEKEVLPQDALRFRDSIQKRREETPIAYITGVKEFYGYEFYVTPDVLIPRPETEELVEYALSKIKEEVKRSKRRSITLLDICSGSGCIGISFYKEMRKEFRKEELDLHLTMSDISEQAVEVSKRNIERIIPKEEANIDCYTGDLFSPLPVYAKYDLILCNPPYIHPSEQQLVCKESLKHEPKAALFCENPEELYISILKESGRRLNPKGAVILEFSPYIDAEKLRGVANTLYDKVDVKEDLSRKVRFFTAEL